MEVAEIRRARQEGRREPRTGGESAEEAQVWN